MINLKMSLNIDEFWIAQQFPKKYSPVGNLAERANYETQW